MIAAAFLIAFAVVSVHSEAQFLGYPQYAQYPQIYDPSYYSNVNTEGTIDGLNPNSRLFFGGALLGAFRPTLTLSTTTTTSTVTSSYTCTTSTAALTTCSPAGRRRRGLLLANKKGRSLFYADDEEEAADGSIFLPNKPEQAPAVEDPVRESRSAETPNLVPFIVQPGFNAPEELRNARQLVSIATRTVSSTTTTTTTVKLTAVCSSVTGFPAC